MKLIRFGAAGKEKPGIYVEGSVMMFLQSSKTMMKNFLHLADWNVLQRLPPTMSFP